MHQCSQAMGLLIAILCDPLCCFGLVLGHLCASVGLFFQRLCDTFSAIVFVWIELLRVPYLFAFDSSHTRREQMEWNYVETVSP